MTALAHPVPDGWALRTPVVESEGNRSSMRQIVSDGWALQTPVVESEGDRSTLRQLVSDGSTGVSLTSTGEDCIHYHASPARRAGGATHGAYSHACMGPERARDPQGSPKVAHGRVP